MEDNSSSVQLKQPTSDQSAVISVLQKQILELQVSITIVHNKAAAIL